ncbi:MAG: alanine--tRNA ligase, partial [Muribaculaceae bacterium]|nr:alanine--tRNA ligase [Muribaculaceae bacterium]
GFPLDLTQLILKENGMTLKQEEFDKEMEAQKTRARNAAAVETSDWVTVNEGDQEFVGYDNEEVETKILRYRQVKQKDRQYYQIILSKTPFYAEMGGQTGDRGTLKAGDETIEIYDTKRENGIGVHLTKKLPADVNATFIASIDKAARQATSCNHTATHLLHHALREVLGTHVEQKGSFVSPDVLRFDFSHFQKLTPDEIRKVEHLANEKIRQAIARDEHRNVPIAKAMDMGAMALFGEKYGEEVRVIKYGDSVELCGGTHVANTGNIGMVKIVSESSIAAGIRRIEAITGAKLEKSIDEMTDTLHQISALLNNAPDTLQALKKAIEENADLRRQAEDYFKENANNRAKDLLGPAPIENGIRIV